MSEAQTLPPPFGELPQPRRRRWQVLWGVPLLLLFLILAAFYAVFFIRSGQDVREAENEAARDLPQGWELEDIEAQRAQVPDSENAALVAMKLRTLLPKNWPESTILRQQPEAGTGDDSRTWLDQFYELPPQIQLDDA